MAEADLEISTLAPWPAELDEPTLRRAQTGDDGACRALIERYERPVFALLHRMMDPERLDRVEEVAQETFVRLLRSLAGLAPLGPARLSIWILTIAARRAIDELQRSDRAAEPFAHDAQPAAARASAALAADERAALLLRAYHRFEIADIARALTCEPSSVESRLHLARAALLRAVGAADASDNLRAPSEPFTRAEVEALAAWTAPAPPPGFADRVLAAPGPAPSTAAAPAATRESNQATGAAHKRGRIRPWVIVAAAGLLALMLVQLRSRHVSPAREAGTASPLERRSIRLGPRGVAVAEPGSSVSWAIESARTRVTQRAGDVFYRIEPGGTVDVETPHGTIRATAACLRIDLDARTTSIAASAVVTVHEGSAVLTTGDRPPHSIAAGHVALIGPQGVRTFDRRRLPPPAPEAIVE
jgi:RNA polymerase sigma-70 factor, ECF subfamily